MGLWDGRRAGRGSAALVGAGATALLAVASSLGGPGGGSAASPGIDGIDGQAAHGAWCEPSADQQARGRPGAHGADPNSLSAEASAAYDAGLQSRVAQRGLAGRAAGERFSTITIDVRVHVIARTNGTGAVTPKMVGDQIDVLNQAFAGGSAGQSAWTPFRFRVASYDVTFNTDWYEWTFVDDDRPAKRALHRGGMDDLNIYIANLGQDLLGYASLPQQQAGARDGVVLLGESLPGGTAAPYNEGDTATHEIGHWLGLFHTFQNGCTAPGDGVDDTPYQNDGPNIFYCRESDDTCAQPGRDPVHNFMSYGDDPCLDRFSEGQGYRMLLSWLAYRE